MFPSEGALPPRDIRRTPPRPRSDLARFAWFHPNSTFEGSVKEAYGRSPSHFRRHIRSGGNVPTIKLVELRHIARDLPID